MISTSQIVLIAALVIGVIVMIWWYTLTLDHKKYFSDYSYTRGANVIGSGSTVKMRCDDPDHEICVYRAVQTCSIPDGNNFETQGSDPMSTGVSGDSAYGDFNPNTTVDFTNTLGAAVNGKQSTDYTFTPNSFSGGMTCPPSNVQLIATYTCIPKGSECTNFNS